MIPDAKQLHDYVDALELPEHRRPRRSTGPVQPSPFSAAPQVVVVGAQLAEFTANVRTDTRSAVADSLLIAQLAANKAAQGGDDVFAWYRTYVEVLQRLGWLVEDLEFKQQVIADLDAGVHTAIIPVITAMLAPGAGALPLVLSVLDGLKQMDSASKWIALFDRASQHAHGAKFQISYVDADPAGNPGISVMCFGLDATRTLTHVLFFKFSQDSATMKSAHVRLSMSLERLQSVRSAVADKVRPFVADYVGALEI